MGRPRREILSARAEAPATVAPLLVLAAWETQFARRTGQQEHDSPVDTAPSLTQSEGPRTANFVLSDDGGGVEKEVRGLMPARWTPVPPP